MFIVVYSVMMLAFEKKRFITFAASACVYADRFDSAVYFCGVSPAERPHAQKDAVYMYSVTIRV